MASSVALQHWIFAAALFLIVTFCCSQQDPAQIVARALLCFNDRTIYNSCKEDYRLNQSGNINVPQEATDEYCQGPCFDETHLVLGCVDGILSSFLFYNRATIQDVRTTLNAACGYSSERGNFNVAAHIQGGDIGAGTHSPFPTYTSIYTSLLLGCAFLL